MSRSSRRRDENPVSLFSFQDIIASVTGIMLLVTLLLVLELVVRKQGPETVETRNPDPSARLQQLQEELDQLKKSMAAQQQTLGEVVGGAVITQAVIDELTAQVNGLGNQITTTDRQIRDGEAKDGQLAAQIDDARGTIADLISKIDSTTAKVNVAARTPKVTVLRGEQSKSPVWVEVDGRRIAAGLINEQVPTMLQQFSGDGDDLLRSFLRWADGRNRAGEVFVLLFRADGVPHFSKLTSLLRSRGFDVGWDVWSQDKQLFSDINQEQK